ncbi:protein piccolo isoform X4 [Microplitis mediator]|uniref:protein piccolo isoform X4 n=1 Tax=Microplitis mediator TaxID=375433 RepID=UPI002556B66B|nr:protein piccolo isoform X4 [Microplitis mediator]
MPANKGPLFPSAVKEKPGNGGGLGATTSKKKKQRASVKNKKNCRQYLQLHSEYRSTYTWHEYTGPHQEHTVVRRAPQAPPTSTKQVTAKLQSAKSTEDENNTEGPTLEPPLPRRKKCPELAYRHHEFITAADAGGIDAVDTNVVADKVREVTGSTVLPASQLSKAISRISTEYRLQFAWPRRAQLTNGDTVAQLPAAGGASGNAGGPPRKSLSMGALKQGIPSSGPAPVHMKKRPGDVDHKRDGVQPSELEPLVGNNTDNIDGVVLEAEERDEDLADLKVAFRPRKYAGKGVRIIDNNIAEENKIFKISKAPVDNEYLTNEIIELRRLADEYKHREWGSCLASEEEATLWNRVSNNHALNALSLARSVTKEEKEKENTRKVAPISNMPPAGRPSSVQARPIYEILQDDLKAVDTEKAIARARKEFLFRHHLDRTTGICDGALLPSPTREKLEPVVPRRRDDSKESHREEIQPRTKSSPKNSPRTGRSQSMGPLSRSPKRQTPRTPSVSKDIKEKEKEHKDKEPRDRSGEPERHPRPIAGVSAVGRVRWSIRESSKSSMPSSSSSKPPVVVSSVKSSTLNEQPIPPLPPPPGPGPTPLQRRPSPRVQRKPFLATTASPRPLHLAAKTNLLSNTTTTTSTTTTNTKVAPNKLHAVHQSARDRSVGRSAIKSASAAATSGSRSLDRVTSNNRNNLSHSPVVARARGSAKAKAASAPTADHPSKSSSITDNRIQSYRANAALQAMTAEPHMNGDGTGGESSVASTPPSQAATVSAPAATAVITSSPWFDDEPVIKSPPEPTRVKSPEQMIMRSPEPVNWTVPLDTGKTFTVTQNVREGEPLTRPHSEAKTWAAPTVHSAPQSAPPELAALHKSHPQQQHSQHSGYKSPESESVSLGSYTGLNGHKDMDSERDSPLPSNLQGTPTPTQSDKGSIAADKPEESKDPAIKPVAGTSLRCLEDPVFEFEKSKTEGVPAVATTAPTTTSTSTATGYRVLEAEDPVTESPASVPTGSGYHVLEAPALSPGSAQRSVASDVLEIARNRFDKFWGKGSDNQA